MRRKAKLPARIKTVEDLLSLDEWHHLSQNLAARECGAVFAIVIIRTKDGAVDIAGTTMPDGEAILLLEEAKRLILDMRADRYA